MKKDDVKIGGTYLAKVTDKVVAVRIDAENHRGGWDATNLTTNKKIRIKSAQRLRGPAPQRGLSAAAAARADRCDVNEADTPLHEMPEAAEPTAAAAGKQAPQKAEGRMSGLDAALAVLKEAGAAMNCGDMIKAMLERGLWKTGGKTPAATLYSAIVREISVKGAESRFRKTDRGLFTVAG